MEFPALTVSCLQNRMRIHVVFFDCQSVFRHPVFTIESLFVVAILVNLEWYSLAFNKDKNCCLKHQIRWLKMVCISILYFTVLKIVCKWNKWSLNPMLQFFFANVCYIAILEGLFILFHHPSSPIIWNRRSVLYNSKKMDFFYGLSPAWRLPSLGLMLVVILPPFRNLTIKCKGQMGPLVSCDIHDQRWVTFVHTRYFEFWIGFYFDDSVWFWFGTNSFTVHKK